jgi:glycosyltransferase involved in cell wall biosynthesis
MRVNILTGTRYHAGLVINILSDIKTSVNIYSSSPASKWNFANPKYVSLHFVPLFSAIFSHLTKINSPIWFNEISSVLFDFFASFMMRKCDVLHAWSSFGFYSIKKAKQQNSIVFVEKSCSHPYHQEAILKEEANKLGVKYRGHSKWFLDRALKEFELADRVIVCSKYTLNSFIENGFPREKLYNVALDANFVPKRRYNRNFNKKEFVVGIAGGNVIRKGFIYLLKAWTELDIPNASLLLRTSRSELKKIPEIWNLIDGDNSIEIIDHINDMEDFYEKCDLFVLPSIDEGFGMVVFEALACSLPVIVSTNVGAGDFINNGKEGFVVDIRNVQQIKDKIETLHSDRQLLQTMSAKAKETYDNYQTRNDNYAKRVKKLYFQCEDN